MKVFDKIGIENESRVIINGRPQSLLGEGNCALPVVAAVRNVLIDTLGMRQEDAMRYIVPELDIEQFEFISDPHHTVEGLIAHSSEIIEAIIEGLDQRYGAKLDPNRSIPVTDSNRISPNLSETYTSVGLLDEKKLAHYHSIHNRLIALGVRESTNVTGLHTNISFANKRDAEVLFSSASSKLYNDICSSPLTSRLQHYRKVCEGMGVEMMPYNDHEIMQGEDEHGIYPFSYRLIRMKKFGNAYGFELRNQQSACSADEIRHAVQQDLSYLL